jgi:hypothetical protein
MLCHQVKGTLRPTVCDTREWAGVDGALAPQKKLEATRARNACRRCRRIPLVGYTLCWAVRDCGDKAL